MIFRGYFIYIYTHISTYINICSYMYMYINTIYIYIYAHLCTVHIVHVTFFSWYLLVPQAFANELLGTDTRKWLEATEEVVSMAPISKHAVPWRRHDGILWWICGDFLVNFWFSGGGFMFHFWWILVFFSVYVQWFSVTYGNSMVLGP